MILGLDISSSIVGWCVIDNTKILDYGSWDLSSQSYDYGITGGSNSSPKWVYWGSGCNDNSTGSNASDISWTSSSYSIEFKGTNYINTKTFFCDAPKGELNWSNNPTFLSQSSLVTGSYVKETDRTILLESKVIHNLASSSNSTFSSSYSNVTYINYVNLFDQDGNLIAIAKTSKPIKKTEDIDFTFKLKLDI